MDFEWDPRKAEINLHKHGISFAEASTVFGDDLGVTVADPDHARDEDRFITVGWTDRHKLLIISHTERNGRIRIISARELTKAERKDYEETK